jgi:rubredoxin
MMRIPTLVKSFGEVKMQYRQYLCVLCGYIYDEALGDAEHDLAPGTRWESIPDDWVCPWCGATKEDFVLLDLPA